MEEAAEGVAGVGEVVCADPNHLRYRLLIGRSGIQLDSRLSRDPAKRLKWLI